MPDDDAKTMNKALFLNMVMMFSTSAMQQLGKIVNPATGKTAVDLQGAQFFIDLLSMLKAKTANNLDRDEARLLSDTLATLQMNYVETAEEASGKGQPSSETPAHQDAPAPGAPEASRPDPSGPSGSTADTSQPPAGKPDDKKPRYHKSYG